MLEVATGSGSSSSDSIVNISRSGASSISTSASTTNTTATTEKLYAEIETLKEEKKVLEGRIRGYKTLSDLLVECRKENEQLKVQVTSLTLFVKQYERMSDVDRRSMACSPFSLVSMEASQQQEKNRNPSPLSMNSLSLSDQNYNNKPPTMTGPRDVSSPSHISNPPVIGPPSSLQETVGPPGDKEETRLISLTTPTGAGSKPAWAPVEKTPKQESLGPINGSTPATSLSPERQGSLSSAGKVSPSADGKDELKGLLASGGSSPELLQPDSDKYDEAAYEKVGRQLRRGQAGLTSSMYAAGGSGEESRPVDFPSLSSGLSNVMAQSQPPSRGSSIFNPPFMAMMHQSQMGAGAEGQNSGIAAEVETITERLSSEPGDSSPAIAFQMHQIAERISRLEQKERDQKKLIDALMRENQELKRQVKIANSAHQAEAVQLREQNTRLMQQLKSQGRGEETTVLKASGSHGDWVHVERNLHMGDSLNASDQSLVDRVRKLEQEKAELQRANSNWKSQWDKMQQGHQNKLALAEQELSALKSRLAEQTSQFESRMLEMKRRIEEEENQKEEAQHQLRLAERRVTELSDQLNEIRTQLSDTARDKQALAAELSVLKAHAAGQEKQTSSAGGSVQGSQAALEAEIAMLKEQLKVFAEDFEHEREDRNAAQSARDAAKKTADNMARQNHSLSSQIKHLQKQIKDRDDTISWTLRQNETLQRQLSDLKKKLASDWEEKQNLQRMLTLAQRQQQQQQSTLRNPYLHNDPQPGYSSAAFYHPPLQPPTGPRTVPYYGGQGASQPMNRAVPTAMSPEHLPGAWTCSACTYINYPGRTVCESCGLVNSPRGDNYGYNSQDMYSSEHALLMSRGGEQMQNGNGQTNGDLVIDSGTWGTPVAQ